MNIGRVLTRPAWLIVLPAVASFVVWAYPWPDQVRRGFDAQAAFEAGTLPYLVAWYGLAVLASTAGWLVGRRTDPVSGLERADDSRVYKILSAIGIFGVFGMYVMVELSGPGLIANAFSNQQFNLVRDQIPSAPGLATLRYATILSGGIALHRIVVARERHSLHYVNVLFLVANVLVASRLALIMAILIFAGLAATRPRAVPIRNRGKRVRTSYIAAGILIVVVLTWANYLRNANYYEQYYHTENPITMMVSESVAYVGSPTQVAVYTTTDTDQDPNVAQIADGMQYLLTPTFFTTQGASEGNRGAWYRGKVSIDFTLNTNSVIAEFYGRLGNWAFIGIALIALAAGFAMGHLSRYRSYMMLGALVIGYCFAEMWRAYLFNAGIIWFLLLALTLSCAVASRRHVPQSSRHRMRIRPEDPPGIQESSRPRDPLRR